jgi:hypothetical protein
MDTFTRRRFLGLASIAGLGAIAPPAKLRDEPVAPPADAVPAPPPVPEEFPTQPPALAREMVGVSHGNLARVTELLALHPTLANAAWDWGFGDWETALGAASHMGNVAITTALLGKGARPTIFSAAMLGQLAVVQAFIAATPGIQGTPGPHGITLLAHAKAGGDAAKAVVAYLLETGGADPVPKAVELTPSLLARFAGVYGFGPRDIDRVEVTIDKGGARFQRVGTMQRALVYLGDNSFHPAGAPTVRIRFTLAENADATELLVFDPDLVLRAPRRA